MGYQVTYLPTEEVINEIRETRPYHLNLKETIENNYTSYIYEILKICMNTQDNTSIYNDVVYIKIWLNHIKQCAIRNCIDDKLYQYEQNHEISFYGWNKAMECNIDIENEYETTLEYLLDNAIIIPTVNFYEDSDKFKHKLENLKDVIHNYYDNVYSWYNFEIMSKLEPYKKPEVLNNE